MNRTELVQAYKSYRIRKIAVVLICVALLAITLAVALSMGAVTIPIGDVVRSLFGEEVPVRFERIIHEIRLPHAVAAIAAGAGLAVAGAAMQGILNNPLSSPFTLGFSHAAAFGAALAIMFGAGAVSKATGSIQILNHSLTTITAFLFCGIEAILILAIIRIRKSSPEIMVLAGVALGSLFTAGTSFLQYFADDVQLGSIVYWSFGDINRAGWNEAIIMLVVTVLSVLFFWQQSWNYNALALGDENARSMGVSVNRVRILGVTVSVLVTSVIISFLGIIGFVGLICPHILRRIVGNDHRFLIPGSALCGSVLLLGADTASRMILAPHSLPVAILTSFMGAPLFLWLLIRRKS